MQEAIDFLSKAYELYGSTGSIVLMAGYIVFKELIIPYAKRRSEIKNKTEEIENRAVEFHIDNSQDFTARLKTEVKQLRVEVKKLNAGYDKVVKDLEKELKTAHNLAIETEERLIKSEEKWTKLVDGLEARYTDASVEWSAKEADYEKRIGELESELKQLKSNWQVVEDGIRTIIGLHPEDIETMRLEFSKLDKKLKRL